MQRQLVMSHKVLLADPAVLQRAKQQLLRYPTFSDRRHHFIKTIQCNQEWRMRRCINLVAAEGPLSPMARSLLSADLCTRTAGGHIGAKQRYFAATHWIDEMEAYTYESIKSLFQCEFCDFRLIGGTQACQVVYSLLTKPGDTVIAIMPGQGGDSSHCEQSMPGLLQLNVIPMPFLEDNLSIDLKRLEQLVYQHHPSLISLGLSVSLFELPLQAIQNIAHQHGARVFYDAAHELGLIAGGCFANPFLQKIDVVSGSTGKTFSGPQGGLLLWNDETLHANFSSLIFPGFVGTYQLNRVAALGLTALEFLEYGNAYMSQVIKNAQALAQALDAYGLIVWAKSKGFTQSHQVLLDMTAYAGGWGAIRRLERCDIIGNPVFIPGAASTLPTGLRLATTEMTRRGMKESEMKIIANLIARALCTDESSSQVAHDSNNLAALFQTIHYC